MGTELAFRQTYRLHKIVQSLEFKRSQLQMLAHELHHLLVFWRIGVCILLQYLISKILCPLHIPYDTASVQVVRTPRC